MTGTGPAPRDRGAAALVVLQTALNQPTVPWLLGLVAIAITAFVWGGLNPVGVYHDEAAYLLQGALFAEGRLVGPVPPIAEFFEQFHVLFSPGVVAKYPPGFALALVPGIWLGSPALIPLLLTGLTAGLGFALARRLVGGTVALLATLIWLAAPANLRFRAGYFSELFTSLLWIAGWWALLEWRTSWRPRWLFALAATVGAAAITRPLTALAFAIPVAVIVLPDVARRRAWPVLGGALAIGTAIVLVLPLQNHAVTGDWRASPYAAYTTGYLPFDRMGFGLDATPPTRELPGDMRALTGFFSRLHGEHTRARLPAIAYQRLAAVLSGATGLTAALAMVLAIIGLMTAPSTVLFAAATTMLLFLAHLPYAHSSDWTLYYLEGFPVIAVLLSLGVARIGPLLFQKRRESWVASGAGDAMIVMALVVFALVLPKRALNARKAHFGLSAGQSYFRDLVTALPDPSIVFVRYGPRHVMHFSLIQNPADYARARVWVVYDRGADNASLLAMAPGRQTFLYDEANLELVPIRAAALEHR